ncbi:YrzI family protein [Brevibacillus sp. B_LB10_24]|uniref:YrzI family protein n=1 Tax=Brevibacillus sp. B_LB10_24 TaxID=3380645 RepID=UPI0038BAF3C5
MRIPMIFFTIVIERKRKSSQEKLQSFLQEKAIAELEAKRYRQAAEYPGYCTRL